MLPNKRHKLTISCTGCGAEYEEGHDCLTNLRVLVGQMIQDIRNMEQQRDGLGRHTTLSAEMESMMSRHPRLFELFK